MAAQNSNLTGNIVNDFINGAKGSIDINLYIQIPNFILSFTVIHMLQISGLLNLLGRVLEPVMSIFSLPGEAAAVLVSSWLSSASGIGATAAMVQQGTLEPRHAVILLPMILCIGSQFQMFGRVLNVACPPRRYYKVCFVIGFINSILSGLLMSFLLKVL